MMPVSNSINEPGGYVYDAMSPGSANEPPRLPAGVFAPKITSLVPNTCPVGGADITVKVSGTGFFEKSVCFVGAPNRPTVFNPADGSLSVTPGTVKVVVRNGVYSSNAVDFTFT
jgi:hypothetical protein